MPTKPKTIKVVQFTKNDIKDILQPHNIDKFKNTKVLIEATDREQLLIWEQVVDKKVFGNIKWVQDSMGSMPNIGWYGDFPIVFNISWDIINDVRVGFWHATSKIVDYNMIEEFLNLVSPDARTIDANNYGNIIHDIKDGIIK